MTTEARYHNLRPTPFERLFNGRATSTARVRQRFQLEQATHPPLRIGELSLQTFGLSDTLPRGPNAAGQNDALVLEMSDMVVHSMVGLIETPFQEVVSDTLVHTTPARDGYHYTCDGAVRVNAPELHLPGVWIHCLLGNDENYFHYMLMNIARLGLIDDDCLASAAGLLLPKPRTPFQAEVVGQIKAYFHAMGGHHSHLAFHELDLCRSVAVDELLVPWNVASAWGAHQHAIKFLRSLYRLRARKTPGHRRIYIDRRQSPNRSLLNEDEVVDLMEKYGFQIVDLERLSVAEQAELFSECHVVVGPHGAGFSNLVFAPEGACVLEILPDRLLNWCYRSISNAMNLQYDCVISRSFANTQIGPTWAPTMVAVNHIESSLDSLMAIST